jgi:membrane-anchored protein YejM (alkaline phosphatase superfamily)
MNDEGGTDFVQVAGPKEIAIEQIYEELLKTRKNKFYKELIQNEINKEQLEIKKKETIQSLKSKVGVVSGAEVSEYNEEQLFADLYGFSKEIREIDIIIDSCIHNIEKDKSLTDTDIDILQNHIKEFNPISKDNLIKY